MLTNHRQRQLLETLVPHLAGLPGVVAVALAGSLGAGTQDDRSDVDCYVYAQAEPSVTLRAAIADTLQAGTQEIGNRIWEPGDEWVDSRSGLQVDIMYRTPEWISGQLDRVLVQHQPSVGYSTCFWYNVLHSQALYDTDDWYAGLQERARQPYPEALREAIVRHNHPLLRRTLSSYQHQILSAVSRHDLVAMNHRLAALLASYFDIILAVNRLPHPGEKRLVAYCEQQCASLPRQMSQQIEQVIWSLSAMDRHTLHHHLTALLDQLDLWLLSEQMA